MFLHVWRSSLARTADPEDGRELDRWLERGMETQNARPGLCGEQVPPFQGSRHFHPKTQASAALWLGLSTFAPLALTATGGIWPPGDAVSLKVG